MALGDLNNAILCCDEAIKIHSDCYIAWLHKTNSYIQLFRFNLSLECANKLVEINDKDYRAWILKSISYSKQMGKSKLSKLYYEKALEVAPDENTKKEIRELKEKLRL